MMSTKLPLWLRFFLLIGVAAFAAGAGLLAIGIIRVRQR